MIPGIRYLLFIVLAFVCFNMLTGQVVHDTILLKEVDIVEKRKLSGIGTNITEVSKIHLKKCEQADLSKLLSDYSPVFIKSYYPGGIATSSIRGVSASHVQVLWNGINLNSPMLGQVDFSGIPVAIIDDVRIYHGSGNIAEHSGALGGSIHLNSNADWNNKLQVSSNLSYGSFNTHRDQLAILVGNNKIQSKTKIYYNYSDNDFTYHDYTLSDLPERKNLYGDYSQKGFQQELYYRLKNRNIISLKTWGQSQNRNIAPIIGTDHTFLPENNEQQHENSFTSIADWDYFKGKHIFNLKLGILYSDLNYINKMLNINSTNQALTNTQKITYKFKANDYIVINALAGNDYVLVKTINYLENQKRHHTSCSINTELLFDHILLTIGNRVEFIDEENHLFAPSIGFDLTPAFLNGFCLSGSYSENMHYPTLNDLYWNPGGNTELLPEKNNSIEVSLAHKYKKYDQQKISHSATIFSSTIDNLIMWLPSENGIWTAINVRKVHARGLEFKQNIKDVSISRLRVSFNSIYSYTLSTNENQINDNDRSYKKQLIYIPKNQFKLNTDLIYRKINLHVVYVYNGKRYISTDNLYYIPEHYLTNISVGRTFKSSKSAININFQIKNLFDQNYIEVAGYPMPGRNYTITLKFTFNK